MKKLLVKRLIVVFIFIISINLFVSCSKKKEYIECGYFSNQTGESIEYDPTLFYKIGYIVSTDESKKQDIEIYFGIAWFDGGMISISSESNLNQNIKLTLYRKMYNTWNPANSEYVEEVKEVYSCENKLSYFFSKEFDIKLRNNKFVDTISKEDLVFYGNHCILEYYFELTPVSNDNIEIVIFEGKNQNYFVIEDYDYDLSPKIYYNNPQNFFSYPNHRLIVKSLGNDKIKFVHSLRD